MREGSSPTTTKYLQPNIATINPSILLRTLFICFLTCLSVGFSLAPSSASLKENPRIVIIDSYHHGYEWSTQELEGIVSRLRESYPTIDPQIEHLDAKRYPDRDRTNHIKMVLKEKYADEKIDVVVALDNRALELLLESRNEIFKDTPIVFGGINDFNLEMLKGQKNITGVAQVMNIQDTLETALKLHPETKKVFMLHDFTTSGLAMRRETERLVPLFSNRITIRFANPLTFGEAVEEIRSLPDDSIGLILAFASDRHGVTTSLAQSTKNLTSVAERPIYSVHFNTIGHGVVGGHVTIGFDHGQRVADVVVSVLAGEEPDKIPVEIPQESKPMFDYFLLEKFRLNPDDLPQGSIIINKPMSFYEQYKSLTIGSIIFGLLLIGAIVVLLISFSKLLKSHRELNSTKNSLARSLREVEIRNQLNTILLKYSDDQMFDEVLKFILEIMKCEFGIFGYFNEDGSFVAPAATGKPFWEKRSIPKEDIVFDQSNVIGLWARSVADKKTVTRNEGPFKTPEGHIAIENAITAPIVFNDVVVSSIHLANKPAGFDKDDARLLEMLAAQIAPVLYARLERDTQDIQRGKAEAEREKSERFLEDIVENIPDMIFVKDVEDLRFVRFNRAGEELLGYSREELLGKNDYDMFPKEQADFFTLKDREVIAGKNVAEIEYEEINTRYKGKRILRTKKLPVLSADGKPQFLLGISTDVTDYKKAEDQLKSSYVRLRQIFDSITGAILVIDSQSYEILYANSFSEELYGRNLEGGICHEQLQELGVPCKECSMSHVIDLKGQPYQMEYYNKILNKHLFVTERIIKWPDGRDVKFQFTVDMTDIKKSEQEREQLQSQLLQAQKMEAVGTLAGGIAHDFNNLLQVILGYSELILSHTNQDDPQYKDLQRIYQAGKRGADLVRSLLTFSRRVETKYTPVDMNQQIAALGSLLSRTIPKNIRIDLQFGGDLQSILADPSQIDQILMNLAVNSRDAMPDGGTFSIKTSNVQLDEEYCNKNIGIQPGDYVMVTVSDTGHGMDQETLEHIFEPFFSTKEVGKGTGLGLATVYGIVKQLRGHITCESKLDQGTTFTIFLPSIQMKNLSQTQVNENIIEGGNENILLVDDDEEIRNLGRAILKPLGYSILTASNGQEALKIYKKQADRISMVVLDLLMPEMDGTKCLDEILALNPQAKVIIASGFSVDTKVKDTLQHKARAFVEKPFDPKKLATTVRTVLDHGKI